MDKYTQFLNFVSYKYNLDFEKLSKDLEEFVIEEKDKLIETNIEDDYKKYCDVYTYRGTKYDKSKVELPAFV